MLASLRMRLWLTYVLVVGVVIAIVSAALVVYLVRNPPEVRQEAQRLRLVTAMLMQRSELISLLPRRPSANQLQAAAERMDAALGVRVVLQDENGRTLVDSRVANEPPLPPIAPQDARRQNALPIIRDANRRPWIYSLRLLGGGQYLIAAAPRPVNIGLGAFRDEFIGPLIQAVLIALVLSLALAAWVSNWIASPLRRIAEAARLVAEASPAAELPPIPLEGPAEVRTLGKAFNEMTARVQAGQKSQRDFVANVSHELKTPLTSIQGFAQAILDGAVDSPDGLHQAAQVIFDEAGRMYRLVMDLLDLARLDSGIASFQFIPLNINQLLGAVISKLAPQAQQGQVDLSLETGILPSLAGDADRLAQVFTNLVENALKYTPAGGQVTVRANSVEGGVGISVTDTGAGIPPDDLPRIFERFYQADKSRRRGNRRGVGLGLAIAREIVQAHGGTVTVSSTVGQGSTFLVWLPADGSVKAGVH